MSASDKSSETIGYCEGLCGGLHSHHLVNGLCPTCQNDIHILTPENEPAELNFNDDDIGLDAYVFIPNTA